MAAEKIIDLCGGSGTKLGFFVSVVTTGTGSSADIAHGLGQTPDLVLAALVSLTEGDAAGTHEIVYGTHDAVNLKFTAPTTVKYIAIAIVFSK